MDEEDEEKTPDIPITIKELPLLDKLVNEAAHKAAKRLIGDGYNFQVILLPITLRGLKYEKSFNFMARPGTVVNIYVEHFRATTVEDKSFIPRLRDMIKRVPQLQRSSALELRNTMIERSKEAKKYTKVVEDKVLPLLPKHRYTAKVVYTVTVTDKISKESVTLSSDRETVAELEDKGRLLLGRTLRLQQDVDDEVERLNTIRESISNSEEG